MPSVPVNVLALLVAVFVNMALGFIWYGPLFGKIWIKMMGWSEADIKKAQEAGMTKSYLLMVLSSFVMAYVLLHSNAFAAAYLQLDGPIVGVMGGFWNWLGFIAPITISSVLWEGKPWKHWLLNNGYNLVSLILMGVILASWK